MWKESTTAEFLETTITAFALKHCGMSRNSSWRAVGLEAKIWTGSSEYHPLYRSVHWSNLLTREWACVLVKGPSSPDAKHGAFPVLFTIRSVNQTPKPQIHKPHLGCLAYSSQHSSLGGCVLSAIRGRRSMHWGQVNNGQNYFSSFNL